MKPKLITEAEITAIEQATKTLTQLLTACESKAPGPHAERYLRVILRLQKVLTA